MQSRDEKEPWWPAAAWMAPHNRPLAGRSSSRGAARSQHTSLVCRRWTPAASVSAAARTKTGAPLRAAVCQIGSRCPGHARQLARSPLNRSDSPAVTPWSSSAAVSSPLTAFDFFLRLPASLGYSRRSCQISRLRAASSRPRSLGVSVRRRRRGGGGAHVGGSAREAGCLAWLRAARLREDGGAQALGPLPPPLSSSPSECSLDEHADGLGAHEGAEVHRHGARVHL